MIGVPGSSAQPNQPRDEFLDEGMRLTRAVRNLLDHVVCAAPSTRTAELADRVEDITRELGALHAGSFFSWTSKLAPERLEQIKAYVAGSTGRAIGSLWPAFNPLAPYILLEVEGNVASGRVRLGPAFAGNPGRVHGGTIATILDHAMSGLLSHLGRPSVTASLAVDYASGAPTGQELSVLANVERIEGRKTYLRAALTSGDRVHARGQGLYVMRAR
ncbi:PaaI family thioesterase [Microbacterium sp. NPDC056044]|uniref:PaaI family thioesterase n=1 Tax=Microbacterium sp. NPDC056044 TaxID=3345690 RepID=UPI0035DE72CE